MDSPVAGRSFSRSMLPQTPETLSRQGRVRAETIVIALLPGESGGYR
jgi:hypothetical protein